MDLWGYQLPFLLTTNECPINRVWLTLLCFLYEYNKRAKDLNSNPSGPQVVCRTCNKCRRERRQGGTNETAVNFECEVCKKIFSSKRSMKIHTAVHTPVYKCARCEKVLSSKQALSRHMRSCRVVAKSNDFTCNICQATFSTKSSLLRHQKIKSMVLSNICVFSSNQSYYPPSAKNFFDRK